MRLSGLLPRRQQCLPGVVGTARIERRPGDLLRRVRPGDIAILNHPDLDRRTAEALVGAGVVGVINASVSISGRFPSLGPELLLSSDVALIDDVGLEITHRIREGTRLRMHAGGIFVGAREIARGTEQDANSVADRVIEAKAGMWAQLETFSANTIEFLRQERPLVLDGVGVPQLRSPMDGRHVVVVAPGEGHERDFRALKPYLREHRPVLVGVEAAADSIRAAGHQPTVAVGSPGAIGFDSLRCGAEIVIPGDRDGYAPGLEHLQRMDIDAVVFPALGNPEDLALLLAEAHGASLVITVGFEATLDEFLDRGRTASNPSTFLTKLKLGSKLVDGRAVADLHRRETTSAGVVCALMAAVASAFGVAFVVSGLGAEYAAVLSEAGESIRLFVGGLCR